MYTFHANSNRCVHSGNINGTQFYFLSYMYFNFIMKALCLYLKNEYLTKMQTLKLGKCLCVQYMLMLMLLEETEI